MGPLTKPESFIYGSMSTLPYLFARSVTKVMDPKAEPVTHICGGCGMGNILKPCDMKRCRGCGYRILYKKLTRRIDQYKAR